MTHHNVLFLCTGNSARSILAECLLNRLSAGRFRAYSAGSQPTGTVNPFALELLSSRDFETAGLRSKSWDEFAAHGAPEMDFIFTVCDNAAGETCPIWPGHPATAHWPFPDPAAVEGTDVEKQAAFAETYAAIEARLHLFLDLPMAELDAAALKKRLNEIGQSGRAALE